MAERLDISKSYCSMLDSGERGISKDIALKLKLHFNVPLELSLCTQQVHGNETQVGSQEDAGATGTEG